jgi:hypothetical protein
VLAREGTRPPRPARRLISIPPPARVRFAHGVLTQASTRNEARGQRSLVVFALGLVLVVIAIFIVGLDGTFSRVDELFELLANLEER